MSEKDLLKIENQLKTAKEQGLFRQNDTSLQPKGKLFGMDAFCWVYPNLEVLNLTLNAFPFPVLWVGNRSECEAMKELNPEWQLNITKVFIFNEDGEREERLETILLQLKQEAIKPGIFLFTSSDANTEFALKQFNEYLNLVQIP
jgi:hypothetical protein